MIVIIDCGVGNIGSVQKALERVGATCTVTQDPAAIEQAEKIILPGVGVFGEVLRQLEERGLREPLLRALEEGTPYLGICVGLQILFERSAESPDAKGLGIIKGAVQQFTALKVPQIGWNKVNPVQEPFDSGYAYFVNSYYCVPTDTRVTSATTNYGLSFASVVRQDNITAVQFHPEKSGKYGLEFLRRWIACS